MKLNKTHPTETNTLANYGIKFLFENQISTFTDSSFSARLEFHYKVSSGR